MGVTLVPADFSKTDLRLLMLYVVAVSMALCEQLYDAFTTDTNLTASEAPPQTKPWFKKKMLEFQYDASNPQVLALDTTTALYAYPTIDTDLQIIKYCSVVGGAFGVTAIKVAKDNAGLPDPLTAPELSAAQSYVNVVASPGLYYLATSKASDKIYMAIDLYYNGQYASVIFTSVSDAINAYLTSIPFDGIFVLSDLEVALKATVGVTDVVFAEIESRTDMQTVFAGTKLVDNYTTITRNWQADSGFFVIEPSPNGLAGTRPDGSGFFNLNLIAV
jgi:hypothetical protein